MENLDKDNQLFAVEKVLEQMQEAEKVISGWNTCWLEQYLDAYSPSLYYTGMSDVQALERKYGNQYKLPNVYRPENRIGEPLKKAVLEDYNGEKHECEFGRIDWYGMKTHTANRRFSFKNNGQIDFFKEAYAMINSKHPKRISYDSSFNVLSDDFDLSIRLNQLEDGDDEELKLDNYSLSIKDNILTEKLNNFEIKTDLTTGKRTVKIENNEYRRRGNKKTSIVFEATLDKYDNLEKGSVEIQTHKGNGRVNGIYRFDVSDKKGVCANFYSRKGNKLDLIEDPILLSIVNRILLPIHLSQNESDEMISNFVNSVQEGLSKGLSDELIRSSISLLYMDTIENVEMEVLEMVKKIKGELPLPGLVERIDNCFDQIDKRRNMQIEADNISSVKKLGKNNNC